MAICEPTGHEEALQDKQWRNAMEHGMLMNKKNDTRELVDIPKDRMVIGLK